MIPAIQTKVKGRNYRSLLEAKWATFFDLCGWQFEYEPFETNGWIPDFLLCGKTKNILVEVKPFIRPAEWEPMISKIEKSLWGHEYFGEEVLLLGVSPFTDMVHYYNIGLIGELSMQTDYTCTEFERKPFDGFYPDRYNFYNAPLTFHDGKWGFSNDEMSFKDRITDHYDGNVEACDISDGEALWAKACNRVQWNRTDK